MLLISLPLMRMAGQRSLVTSSQKQFLLMKRVDQQSLGISSKMELLCRLMIYQMVMVVMIYQRLVHGVQSTPMSDPES